MLSLAIMKQAMSPNSEDAIHVARRNRSHDPLGFLASAAAMAEASEASCSDGSKATTDVRNKVDDAAVAAGGDATSDHEEKKKDHDVEDNNSRPGQHGSPQSRVPPTISFPRQNPSPASTSSPSSTYTTSHGASHYGVYPPHHHHGQHLPPPPPHPSYLGVPPAPYGPWPGYHHPGGGSPGSADRPYPPPHLYWKGAPPPPPPPPHHHNHAIAAAAAAAYYNHYPQAAVARPYGGIPGGATANKPGGSGLTDVASETSPSSPKVTAADGTTASQAGPSTPSLVRTSPLASEMASSDRHHVSYDERAVFKRRASMGKWTEVEDDALRSAVKEFGGKSWKKIASRLPGRTDVQCLHRWQKV